MFEDHKGTHDGQMTLLIRRERGDTEGHDKIFGCGRKPCRAVKDLVVLEDHSFFFFKFILF